MLSLIIDDGYTLKGFLPGLDGVYPDVRFRYRLAGPLAVSEYLSQSKGEPQLAAMVSLVAKHLVEWDVKDRAGNRVPIREDILRRVPFFALDKIAGMISGYMPADMEQDEKNSEGASGSS